MTDEPDTDDQDRVPKNRKRIRMIPLVFLAITVIIMLALFSTVDNWRRDLTTNYAELSDQAADADLRPVTVTSEPEEVAEQISGWANQHSLWNVESRENQGEMIVMHLTRTTPVLRFTDDLHVQLQPDGAGTRVTAQSQSRVGKGDLGQNPRNLKELVRVVSAGG